MKNLQISTNHITASRTPEITSFVSLGDFIVKYWVFQFWIFILAYNALMITTKKIFVFGILEDQPLSSESSSEFFTIVGICLVHFLFELLNIFKCFKAYKQADAICFSDRKNTNTIYILRKIKSLLIAIMVIGFLTGSIPAGIGGIITLIGNLVCKYYFWNNLKKIKLLYSMF